MCVCVCGRWFGDNTIYALECAGLYSCIDPSSVGRRAFASLIRPVLNIILQSRHELTGLSEVLFGLYAEPPEPHGSALTHAYSHRT